MHPQRKPELRNYLVFMNTKVKGYILGAVAAATYGMNPLFTLPLYKEGMNPDSVLFFRYLFAIPILGIMLKARGRSFSLKRKEILPLVILGWLVAISSLTLFQSYNYMEAGIASTILFVYPISLVGVGLVMASALSYAIYIVGVNRPILKDVATLKVTFYVLLFGLSLFLIRVDFGQSLHVVDKWYLWGNLIALAIFPTAISFLCTTQAVQYIGSTPTAILGALEPVTAVFFGVTIFGESLTLRLCCGIVLIILAVTFIIAGSNITTHLVRFRKLFPRLPLKHIKK